MKNAFFACLLTAFLFDAPKSHAVATTLAAGELVFTGLNTTLNTINGTESNREFSFILLKAVGSGTEIYFTDYGWLTAGGFQTACSGSGSLTDGIIKWSTAVDLPYGTFIRIRCRYTPSASVGTAIGFQATYNSATEFVTMTSAGETIFAYQGSFGSPTLISALNTSSSGWAASLASCDLQPTASTLPAALSTNNLSFAYPLGGGNIRLKPSVGIPGNAAAARVAVYNSANWENSTTAYLLPPTNTLPVTLTVFNAKIENNFSKINWGTESEVNSWGFLIYRSDDKKNFNKIGEVLSKQGTEPKSYQFIDKNPMLGNNYYRLLQVDSNGDQTILGERILKHYFESEVSVHPNPAKDFSKITFPEGIYSQLELRDAKGDMISRISVGTYENNKVLNLTKLNSGIYIVVLLGDNVKKALKMVKK